MGIRSSASTHDHELGVREVSRHLKSRATRGQRNAARNVGNSQFLPTDAHSLNVQRIIEAEILDPVAIQICKRVAQQVGARPELEEIVACSARHAVGSDAPIYDVVAVPTMKSVIAGSAPEHVIATKAVVDVIGSRRRKGVRGMIAEPENLIAEAKKLDIREGVGAIYTETIHHGYRIARRCDGVSIPRPHIQSSV
jgi:hypothetical protein